MKKKKVLIILSVSMVIVIGLGLGGVSRLLKKSSIAANTTNNIASNVDDDKKEEVISNTTDNKEENTVANTTNNKKEDNTSIKGNTATNTSDKQTNNNSNKLKVNEEIKEDFKDKSLKAQEVLPTGQGFFKYYTSLIKTLKEYDISNVENAYTVYLLSDELLNNMYKEFKNNWDEESFNKLKDSQIIWVNNKVNLENELNGDDLTKYQKLVTKTLDRCAEWTQYYQ